MNIVPNINSKIFTTSAFIIGLLLIDESTPAEQNSLGNWFMMIGQVLCTNSAQQQVINNRNNISNNSNQHIISDYNSPDNEIEMINKVIRAMQEEINNLKNNI